MTSEQPQPTSRLFTAIPLSHEVREHVSSIAQELSREVGEVRWVPPENLHVTLRFLGDFTDAKVPDLVAWMRKAAAHLPFGLDIGGVGGFPSQGSAKVIWVGAIDETGAAGRVYDIIDKGAAKCGCGRENRKYKPHITVGRSRRRPVRIERETVDRFAGRALRLDVNDIVLYKSVLKSTGAEYTEIQRVGSPT
jgi:RNA 2',3'-cyclic 3'-phosphodiesterase